jgi:hypothetical protein
MNSIRTTLLAFPPLIILGLSSCGLENKPSGPEPTAFLKSTGVDMAERATRLPFDHSWRDPSFDISEYKYIVVRPVTTAFLRSEMWEESKSSRIPDKRSYLRQCDALARHWNQSLAKAFSSPVCMFYKTTDTSRPGTLILEVALTEARFQSSGAPGSLPICAFESRAKDAATGKLISTAYDRRGPGIAALGSGKSNLAAPNEQICDEWSQQLMQRSNMELYPVVKRRGFSFF